MFIAIVLIASQAVSAPKPGHKQAEDRRWIGVHLDPKGSDMPFSFVYGGRKSADILPGWRASSESRKLDANRRRLTIIRTDPASGLQMRCVAIQYSDYPAVEWTVYLKNTGNKDTPIVENLQALDTTFERTGTDEFLLHHNVGSPASRSDYGPLETPLTPSSSKRISAAGGRPTNTDMSYFNLAWGKQGTIVVVGWPGQWAADFARDSGAGLHVTAGQELTHFKLHPGEEVRTPLIVLLNWTGDWTDGQNQWRRWMMSYGMPKPGGQLPKPMFLGTSGRAYGEMIGANEANQIMHIDRYLEEGLKIDYWWMDAGWYVQQQGWPQVGTWEVDKSRFPQGFKPISDHAHSKGVKILVWFEPERVAPGTWLADNHPEWLLNPLSALEMRKSTVLGTNEPCVVFNRSDDPLAWSGIKWEPRSLSFHPGPNGEFSVIRWTAPAKGEYQIDSAFAGIDGQTTTDVHVLRDGKSLFDGFINLNGQGKRTPFQSSAHLEAGDNLDFVVGYGNKDYRFDSTGMDATITGPDGKRHSAAKEYGGGYWSYGCLAPGAAPDASTFKAYDSHGQGGATGTQLLDLGNPKAWKWLVEHVDRLIVDSGIDLYRQDFNMDPLIFWRGNDTVDRQGITENRHVVGYLAYWDELRRRHPNMLIDSCASGGRRNDLETMRRAVPMWRSDYAFEPIGHQCMTYGISMWLPYYGTGTVATADAPYYGGGLTPVQPYAFWSNATPSLVSGIDLRVKEIDYSALRRLFGDWREVVSNYYGDYYPLTSYSQADDTWIAWQFNRPQTGEGVVQAFRRGKAADEIAHLKLRGLDPKASYIVKVLDGEALGKTEWSGAELMDHGLPVSLKDRPAAAVITYTRAQH